MRRGVRNERLPRVPQTPQGRGEVCVADGTPETVEQHAGGRGTAEAHTGAERHDTGAAEEVTGPGPEDRTNRDGNA